jgi:hypothetical protein
MNIQELIDRLKNHKTKGFQIQKQSGRLTSTWLIFLKDNHYYFFDINQDIEFTERYRYTEDELKDEFVNAFFSIEEDCV